MVLLRQRHSSCEAVPNAREGTGQTRPSRRRALQGKSGWPRLQACGLFETVEMAAWGRPSHPGPGGPRAAPRAAIWLAAGIREPSPRGEGPGRLRLPPHPRTLGLCWEGSPGISKSQEQLGWGRSFFLGPLCSRWASRPWAPARASRLPRGPAGGQSAGSGDGVRTMHGDTPLALSDTCLISLSDLFRQPSTVSFQNLQPHEHRKGCPEQDGRLQKLEFEWPVGRSPRP